MSKRQEKIAESANRVALVCICTRVKVGGKLYVGLSPSCPVHWEHENLRLKNLGAMQPA